MLEFVEREIKTFNVPFGTRFAAISENVLERAVLAQAHAHN